MQDSSFLTQSSSFEIQYPSWFDRHTVHRTGLHRIQGALPIAADPALHDPRHQPGHSPGEGRQRYVLPRTFIETVTFSTKTVLKTRPFQ